MINFYAQVSFGRFTVDKTLLLAISFYLSFLVDVEAQNLGIGTQAPVMNLHVSNEDSAVLLLENIQPLNSNISTAMYFKTGNGSYPYTGALKTIGTGIYYSRLGLFTYASDTPNGLLERLSITDEGNVGIGTITPANKLSIMGNTDISGNLGIGTTTPAASAQLEISSTTKGFLPPRMTAQQRDEITPAEGLIIYNTSTKRPNYFNGTEWKNFDETSAVYQIGYPYQGGIIAYIFQPGDPGYIAGEYHGFIAAASDQSIDAQWGCTGTEIPGADATALGTGHQNTIDILNGCATAGIAARICDDLVLNGYSDWYLPSLDELDKLYINREEIGGFSNGLYWSSTEFGTFYARFLYFENGVNWSASYKYNFLYVRAIRSF